ncbi:bifunctional 4-hydroxy-2-oxoglutarate aldolase/2-dehydro-3-deoxy-phosphogluconate aldolase [Bythopirellula polymerisocia]|uniref:2-dehydro-3-deoxy-phosphogluconate aldolase n=1 Tax=Bythopirellula polymerisocia TaxID=2528003 RepID=A0A5C6CVJ6_9BACT|nr:bifunctional 4-hydroxy-2-oxoglutarate aldolase/2-dehydro-3-deoxy-phosphogluconate aldolase [Bythopirellula polymerisocia]TWU27471.1 KHG/KDPG aldolase [Bythopirellula polymerisocia]
MKVPPIFEKLESAGVLAVVILDDIDTAVPLAKALLSGGVNAMELTLRTEAALDSLAAIRQEVPDMLVGAGTILKPEQVSQVIERGALFGVSPGFNRRVVDSAATEGLPFAPGIATASDIEAAIELGCRLLKYFPAEALGGLKYLRAMSPPYHHLGVKYVPLGGVGRENLAEYIVDPLIAFVGGSWLTPKDKIIAKDWKAIEELACQARTTIDAARKK